MIPCRKILITGATGFLGSRLAEHFHAAGVTVLATGRNLQKGKLLQKAGIEFLPASLEHYAEVHKLTIGCDAVVHAAALSAPWGRAADFYNANVLATQQLLSAAANAGVKRFIYISTPSIYFNYRHRTGIKESDPLPHKMVNHYARTKYEAEQLVLQSGMEAIALRPRAIIGRGDTVIMPRVLKAYHAGKLRQVGDGTNLADLTAAANVVHAVECALHASEAALGRAYNITDGTPVKLWEAIGEVLTQLGFPPMRGKVPYTVAFLAAACMEAGSAITGREPLLTKNGVGTLHYSITLDISLAQQMLGYKPVQTTQQGLQEFCNWYQLLSPTEREAL